MLWLIQAFLRFLLLPQAPWEDTTIRYNVPLLNAIVLHLGTQAVSLISSKNTSVSAATVATCPQTSLLHNLTAVLETDGTVTLSYPIRTGFNVSSFHNVAVLVIGRTAFVQFFFLPFLIQAVIFTLYSFSHPDLTT